MIRVYYKIMLQEGSLFILFSEETMITSLCDKGSTNPIALQDWEISKAGCINVSY